MPRKQFDMCARASRRQFIAVGRLLVVTVIGFALSFLLDLNFGGSLTSAATDLDAQTKSEVIAQTQPPRRAARFEVTTSRRVLGHFFPERVLGNPKCRMRIHSARRGDTALVVLPTSTGARFAALDSDGPMYTCELPFRPRGFSVVRRRDGSVLMAFADINYALLDDGSTERSGFARVCLDGQSILVHDMVWDLEIAPDGSSYFFVEPLEGETSQMVIHNLDLDLERKHFLDNLYNAPPSSHRYYSTRYSKNNSEIMFFPDYEGVGEHRFLLTGASGGWRRVDVSDIENLYTATFTSSEAGFFVTDDRGEMRSQLFRRDFEWESSEWQSVDRWSITLPESVGFNFPMQFSRDGSKLLAHGEEMILIDTDNGEVLFRFPMRDKSAQLSRLVHILGPDATEADVGTAVSPWFRGEQLWLLRRFGGPGGRTNLRRVHDVFDLTKISIDAGPDYRVPYNPPRGCAPVGPGQPGLRVVGGRLVYGVAR